MSVTKVRFKFKLRYDLLRNKVAIEKLYAQLPVMTSTDHAVLRLAMRVISFFNVNANKKGKMHAIK